MPVQSTGASPFGAGSGLTSTFRPAVNVTEQTGRNARLQHNVMPPSMSRTRAEMRPTASAEPKEEFAAKRLSEEESIRSDEQKVLEKLASPRVFIPNEVPRGKRTREVQAQYLLDSYKSEDLTLLFAEAGLDFFNPVSGPKEALPCCTPPDRTNSGPPCCLCLNSFSSHDVSGRFRGRTDPSLTRVHFRRICPSKCSTRLRRRSILLHGMQFSALTNMRSPFQHALCFLTAMGAASGNAARC